MADPKPSKQKTRRSVRVHGIDEARAACDAAKIAGVPIALWSPPFGAARMGPLWFQQMIALIGEEFPDVPVDAVLDCGDAPGHALAALRQGVPLIALTARPAIRRKIEAIAAAGGARLVRRPPRIFDPASPSGDRAALKKWLDRSAD